VASEKRLELRGEFLERYTVLLDNKVNRGRPGYHVVQPLRLGDGRQVLVNRGWVAAPLHREQLPQLRTPPGLHDIEGRVLDHFPRAYAPSGAKPEGRVWQNVEVATFAVWSGLKLEPYVIEQHSPLADGLARNWPRADAGVEKHEGYALQWYSLAALSVVLFVALSIRRERKLA
jgi:cytochrome oxidase assembly protein ShyY1